MRRLTRLIELGLQTLLAMGALFLFALLPLALTQAAGHLLGSLAFWLPNELRFAARRNIAACLPQLDKRQQKHLLRTNLRETHKNLLEAAAVWLWPRQRILNKVRKVHGEELVTRAMAGGKGVIFAVPHLGSWEMANLYCSSRYPLTSLYRPSNLPSMDNIIRRGREKMGARLVPTDNRGVKSLLEALKRGETVFILPDQVPGKGQGEYAPFFDLPAYSMTLLGRLANKTGASVIFCYARRLPYGRGFEMVFHDADEQVYANTPETSVVAMNRSIEACVRELPEQYLWSYRRFKRPPAGERNIYVKNS